MGRPKSIKKLAEEQLENALNRVSIKKAKRTDGVNYLLEHLVTRAYTSDSVLVALTKKLLPDLSINEGGEKTNIYNLINQIRADLKGDSKSSLELDSRDGLHEG